MDNEETGRPEPEKDVAETADTEASADIDSQLADVENSVIIVSSVLLVAVLGVVVLAVLRQFNTKDNAEFAQYLPPDMTATITGAELIAEEKGYDLYDIYYYSESTYNVSDIYRITGTADDGKVEMILPFYSTFYNLDSVQPKLNVNNQAIPYSLYAAGESTKVVYNNLKDRDKAEMKVLNQIFAIDGSNMLASVITEDPSADWVNDVSAYTYTKLGDYSGYEDGATCFYEFTANSEATGLIVLGATAYANNDAGELYRIGFKPGSECIIITVGEELTSFRVGCAKTDALTDEYTDFKGETKKQTIGLGAYISELAAEYGDDLAKSEKKENWGIPKTTDGWNAFKSSVYESLNTALSREGTSGCAVAEIDTIIWDTLTNSRLFYAVAEFQLEKGATTDVKATYKRIAYCTYQDGGYYYYVELAAKTGGAYNPDSFLVTMTLPKGMTIQDDGFGFTQATTVTYTASIAESTKLVHAILYLDIASLNG